MKELNLLRFKVTFTPSFLRISNLYDLNGKNLVPTTSMGLGY